MRPAATVLLALIAASGPALAADFWVVAFGDSITHGCCDEPRDGGYPERLATLMNCTYFSTPWPPPDGPECLAAEPFPACAVQGPGNCVIANRGLAFDKATAALTRLQNEVLPEWPWDVLVFMEGTNDVFNQISTASIKAAIEMIEAVTTEAGVDFVLATIIEFHPDALVAPPVNRPLLNINAAALNTEIAAIAGSRNRYLSDQWSRICPQVGPDFHGHDRPSCWNLDYGEKSIVGHPSFAGYLNMAGDMAGGFFGTLTQAAVPGAVTPIAPADALCGEPASFDWTKETGETANWYRVEINGAAYDAWHQEVDWRPAEIDLCLPDADPDDACSLINPLVLGAGIHSWRVRGRNPGGVGPWSAATPFEVFVGAPSATVGTYPADFIFDTTPTYRWDDETTASEYDLEVFDGTVWVSAGTYGDAACNGASCAGTPAAPDLMPGERKFRVRSRNPCGMGGPLSSEVAFTVLDCAAHPDLPLQNTMVTNTRTELACGKITAGNLGAGDYVIDGPVANVLFHAGSTIEIWNGFSVLEGSFTAIVDD